MADKKTPDPSLHAQDTAQSVSRVTPTPHRRLVTPGEAKKRAERRSRGRTAVPHESAAARVRFKAAQRAQDGRAALSEVRDAALNEVDTETAFAAEPESRLAVAVAEKPIVHAEPAFREISDGFNGEPTGDTTRADSVSEAAQAERKFKSDAAKATAEKSEAKTSEGAAASGSVSGATVSGETGVTPEEISDRPAAEAAPGQSDAGKSTRPTTGQTETASQVRSSSGEPEPAPQTQPTVGESDTPPSANRPEPASGRTTFRRTRVLLDTAESKPAGRKRALLLISLFAVLAAGLTALYFWLVAQPPVISGVDAATELNEDGTVTLTVELRNANFLTGPDVWCAMTETEAAPAITDSVWIKARDGVCAFNVSSGTFYLHAVDAKGNRSVADSVTAEANGVLSLVMPDADSTAYLAYGDRRTYTAEVVAVGDANDAVTWSSSDPAVASVEDGVVTAGETSGAAVITATAEDGHEASATVVVTELIQLPQIINPKTVLPSDRYTDEEAHLLDDILFSRVEEAGGYGTRGAVVAATRFLLLEFPYRISYFFENGRLTNDTDRPQCDGEGRYSHRGLYLCACKFDELEAVRWGPVIWGNSLLNWQEEYQFLAGQQYPNGLDCSGFVCWCLVNGGYDFGDVGAGDTWRDDDLCDLGEQVPITNELMASGRVKAGDLIGKDGHIAIILGYDETNIYIAESLPRGVVVSTYKLHNGVCYSSLHDYIMLMDDEYGEEGVYENDPFAGLD